MPFEAFALDSTSSEQFDSPERGKQNFEALLPSSVQRKLLAIELKVSKMVEALEASAGLLSSMEYDKAKDLIRELKALLPSKKDQAKELSTLAQNDQILLASEAEASAEYKKSISSQVFDTVKDVFSTVGGYVKEVPALLLAGVPKLFSWAIDNPKLLLFLITVAFTLPSIATSVLVNKELIFEQISTLWGVFMKDGISAVPEKIIDMVVNVAQQELADATIGQVATELGDGTLSGNGLTEADLFDFSQYQTGN